MNEPATDPHIIGEGPFEPYSHQFLDAVSLEWHRLMAARIRRDPSLLRIPRENIARWLARDVFDEGEKRSLLAWTPLLDRSRLDELIAAMTDPGQRGQQMRQSTPFPGVVPQSEYEAIEDKMIEKWKRREAHAAI